jgi:HlyD family secretion protein
VAVAEATLADAQAKLTTLQTNPDLADVQAAQVRVLVAQATIDKLALRAPFDGEVLRVNYQPGDVTSPAQVAVIIANRTQLHVNVSVDESDIGQIAAGQSVSITFDSLPDVQLAGTVVSIDPIGQTSQGLVRYTVRVDAAQTNPQVLLGMTANVEIVTNVQTGALAVPLDAVQLEGGVEYVNRVNIVGGVERVNVVSGEVQEEFVLVTGALSPGDTVQLIVPQPANAFGGPFGGGRP